MTIDMTKQQSDASRRIMAAALWVFSSASVLRASWLGSPETGKLADQLRRIHEHALPPYRICVVALTQPLVDAMFGNPQAKTPEQENLIKALPKARALYTEDQSCFWVTMRTRDLKAPDYTDFSFHNRGGKEFALLPFMGRASPLMNSGTHDPFESPYVLLSDALADSHNVLVGKQDAKDSRPYATFYSGVYCGAKIDFSKPYVFEIKEADGTIETLSW